MRRFADEVCEKLRCYVYMLLDPRDGSVFYVGKGVNNRCFEHAEGAIRTDQKTQKYSQIREMLSNSTMPEIFILRHDLTEEIALEIEAAVIDGLNAMRMSLGLDGLSNVVSGHGVERAGLFSDEIVERYGAEAAEISVPAMVIKVERAWSRGMPEEELYEQTRRYWKANPKTRKPQPEFVFAVSKGIIRQVYRVDKWETYSDMDDVIIENQKRAGGDWDGYSSKGYSRKLGVARVGFVGSPDHGKQYYIGMSVRNYPKTQQQNPISYVNC